MKPRATFGGVTLACLVTQNYFFTIPLALLIGGFVVFAVLWPERARQKSKKGNLVTSTSPLWWVRLVGMGFLVLALAGIGGAYHEARTNPNCMANQSSD